MKKPEIAKWVWIVGIVLRLIVLVVFFVGNTALLLHPRVHFSMMPHPVSILFNILYVLLTFFALLIIADFMRDKKVTLYAVIAFVSVPLFYVWEHIFPTAIMLQGIKNGKAPSSVFTVSFLGQVFELAGTIFFILALFKLARFFGNGLFKTAGISYLISAISVFLFGLISVINAVTVYGPGHKFLSHHMFLTLNALFVGGGIIIEIIALIVLLVAVFKTDAGRTVSEVAVESEAA